MTFHANCLQWKQFAWNVKSCFLGKIRKNISKCRLLINFPRVLSVKQKVTHDSQLFGLVSLYLWFKSAFFETVIYYISAIILYQNLVRVRRKSAFEHKQMSRFRSPRACTFYHQGLRSPFIHSVVSIDCVSGEWRPWSDCADAQADLGLHCPHMPEDMYHYQLKRLRESLKNISL